MKVEVLYPEIANLYGCQFDIEFIKKYVADIEVYYTNLNDKPHFSYEDIDLIYLGHLKEDDQCLVIQALKPYQDDLTNYIENEKMVFCVGNALEVFLTKIDDIDALAIFKGYAKRDFSSHYYARLFTQYNDLKLVGYLSNFSYANDIEYPFAKVLNGKNRGNHPEYDGIHYKNFFGTYMIGPMFVMNPLLFKHLMEILKVENVKLTKDVLEAYDNRLNAFETVLKFYQ